MVAVKQIAAHLAEDREFLQRFRKEAQILARLGAEQPAVVTIYELIEDQRGLFIVMEFVHGHTLETVLKNTSGPVETKAALQILWRLAAALHNVHAAGIVHRDIKPANVIICEGLRPKITDFGVAASMSGQTAMLLGTTKYMAPELFSDEQIDGRADMYSLGMIAYEMLIGSEKFGEIFADLVRDPQSESLRWMKWHGDLQLAAPMLDAVNPSIPPALAEIVAKMMAKERGERFESMEMLGRAIRGAFSPRGAKLQVPAPVLPQAEAPVFEQPVRVRDAGDDLQIGDESADTAIMPAYRKGFKTNVLVGIIVFTIALITAVGFVVHREMQIRARREQALAAFTLAEPAYRNSVAMRNIAQYHLAEVRQEIVAQFHQASDGFSAIKEQYPNTVAARKAAIMELLCQSRLAVLQRDWNLATKLMNKAEQTVQQAQLSASPTSQMHVWAKQTRQLLDDFDIYMRNARVITAVVAKVDVALKEGDFAKARQMIADQLQSPALAANAQRLDKQVDRSQFVQTFKIDTEKFNALLVGVVDQTDSGKFEKVRLSLASATAIEKDISALLGSKLTNALSKDDGDRFTQQLKNASERAKSLLLYVDAMEQAEAARQGGDPQAEQAALRNAKVILPAQAKRIELRIKQIKIDVAIAAASEAMAAGNIRAARAKFGEVLKIDPTHKDALSQIEKLGIAIKLDVLKDEAKDAFAAGDFKAAMAKYKDALKIAPGEAILFAGVTDCRFELTLAEASVLFHAKHYGQAFETLAVARKLKPAAADRVDALLVDYQSWQEYDNLLVQGDKAGKDGDWAKAKSFYQKAFQAYSTKEAKKRLARAHYQQWIASAKLAINADNFTEARAHLQQARSKAPEAGTTEQETKELIAAVDQLLKEIDIMAKN